MGATILMNPQQRWEIVADENIRGKGFSPVFKR